MVNYLKMGTMFPIRPLAGNVQASQKSERMVAIFHIAHRVLIKSSKAESRICIPTLLEQRAVQNAQTAAVPPGENATVPIFLNAILVPRWETSNLGKA